MKKEDIEVKRENIGKNVKFIIQGIIDSNNAEALQIKLEEALKNGENNIILNMSGVEYLCSVGVRVILKAYKAAKETGGIVGIEQPSENVRKVLVVTSLVDILVMQEN